MILDNLRAELNKTMYVFKTSEDFYHFWNDFLAHFVWWSMSIGPRQRKPGLKQHFLR